MPNCTTRHTPAGFERQEQTVGLRDLVNKGKCLVGLHEGEWKAASATTCTFTRKCVRCAAEHSRVEHPWGEWRFLEAATCDQQRTCQRCQLHEQRVQHAFGAPAFVSTDSCERQEECARCHARRNVTPQHSLTAWRFVSADECQQVQQCGRCKADGTVTRVEHAWAEWQHSNAHNAPVRVCRRCGELQARPAPVEQARAAAPVISTDDVADLLARAGTAQATRPAAAPSSSTTRDPSLVAHWRHTSAMSGSGFSMVTDTHLVLQGDGRFRRWTHTASSMGEQTSEALTGSWHNVGDVLHSRSDDGSAGAITYTVQGSTLFFPEGGSQKIWERVR